MAEEGAPGLLGEVRGVQLFSDGNVVRKDKPMWPDIPADPTSGSKDVVLDEKTGIWARIFLPQSLADSSSLPPLKENKKKLPLLVYFHGGGFVAFQPSSSIFHTLCTKISSKFGLLVISVAYRLAPEHRLPVAFEDSFQALTWIQQQAKKAESGGEIEPWMEYADVSNCFLMGGSAGGTIVHYLAVKANEYDFSPLKVKGLFSVVPFFGGEERSASEIRSLTSEPDYLTLEDTDIFWSFSLPEGTNRDHPFCRCPTPEELTGLEFPRTLIVVGAKDVLHSRQIEYAQALKKAGKDVQLLEYKNIGHMLLFPEVGDDMKHSFNEMIQFMDKCMS